VELPIPKLESWKYEEKRRPKLDPSEKSYKYEIMKIQKEIARERKNERNGQLQLQDFLLPTKKAAPVKPPKLEGDSLEKLWRPNIKREYMHQSGEVRLKYDVVTDKNAEEDVDEEFAQEVEEDFADVKPAVKDQSKQETEYYERLKAEKLETSYFGGQVKLERTKEEKDHLKFVKTVDEEHKKFVYLRDNFQVIDLDEVLVVQSQEEEKQAQMKIYRRFQTNSNEK
jgi:hypothetical protein